MSSDAGGLSADDDVDARAALELHTLLGDGDDTLGRERLTAWLALGVLPDVPAYVRTSHALCRADVGWTRVGGPITPALLLGHFRSEQALGGVFAGESSVVVYDIDNQAGKDGAAGVDADLLVRADVVRRAAPRAVWVRSSASGGLHAWTFLDEPHPLRVLVYLARERLLRATTCVPQIAETLRLASVGGVPGFLEILPQLGAQGGVIRTPLGTGSALLDDHLRPLELSPGEALARFVEWARLRRLRLLEAFPREPPGSPSSMAPERLPPASPRRDAVPIATAGHARSRLDWRALLFRCDGRLRRELRPPRSDYESVMRRLWNDGLPGPSTRHAATFLLALSCRWQGLTRDEAESRVNAWFEERGHRSSREWQRSPRRAARKTRSIIRHTYRERAPRPECRRRARYARPGTVSIADQFALERLLPADPLAVDVALRVLCFARTNARVLDTGRVVCELPLRALGITTRRRRAAWQRVHDTAQVFRLYAARVPRRDDGHPLGPSVARAARYTLLWSFEERGPRIRERACLSFRRVRYLVAAPCDRSRSANTVRRPCVAPSSSSRVEIPAGARPVGAGRAVARQPLWETRSVFQGPVGGSERVLHEPSTGPAAAAASIGPRHTRPPPRRHTESRSDLACCPRRVGSTACGFWLWR